MLIHILSWPVLTISQAHYIFRPYIVIGSLITPIICASLPLSKCNLHHKDSLLSLCPPWFKSIYSCCKPYRIFFKYQRKLNKSACRCYINDHSSPESRFFFFFFWLFHKVCRSCHWHNFFLKKWSVLISILLLNMKQHYDNLMDTLSSSIPAMVKHYYKVYVSAACLKSWLSEAISWGFGTLCYVLLKLMLKVAVWWYLLLHINHYFDCTFLWQCMHYIT